MPTSPSAVYGVLSLVFWAVTIIVSVKAVARNASNPVTYFRLPDDRTVVMGSHVTL